MPCFILWTVMLVCRVNGLTFAVILVMGSFYKYSSYALRWTNDYKPLRTNEIRLFSEVRSKLYTASKFVPGKRNVVWELFKLTHILLRKPLHQNFDVDYSSHLNFDSIINFANLSHGNQATEWSIPTGLNVVISSLFFGMIKTVFFFKIHMKHPRLSSKVLFYLNLLL